MTQRCSRTGLTWAVGPTDWGLIPAATLRYRCNIAVFRDLSIVWPVAIPRSGPTCAQFALLGEWPAPRLSGSPNGLTAVKPPADAAREPGEQKYTSSCFLVNSLRWSPCLRKAKGQVASAPQARCFPPIGESVVSLHVPRKGHRAPNSAQSQETDHAGLRQGHRRGVHPTAARTD